VPRNSDDAGPPSLTIRLRAALTDAMSSRGKVATAAIRSALGAIGNAEAIAAPAHAAGTSSQYVAGAVSGLGQAEASRRRLSEFEISLIVEDEIAEREAAAARLDKLGHAGEAERLRGEAVALARFTGAS
jgi:uncharacterized protein YqeY